MPETGFGSPATPRALHVRVTIGGRTYDALVEVLDGASSAPGVPAPAVAAQASAATRVEAAAEPRPAEPAATAPGAGAPVRAALPGVVSEVRVRPGDAVAAGAVLLVLEAMKMDNDVTAPVGGSVREVLVAKGQQVAAQQVLVVIE